MHKATAKKAHVLYNEHFNTATLEQTYERKVSSSQIVGKDGVSQKIFKDRLDAEIDLILTKVETCNYQFTPYKARLLSKGPNKPPRVLSIPTIRDRLTLRILNDILSKVFYDARLWRPHVYIKEIKSHLESGGNNLAFVRIDIKDFYPSIDHEILMKRLKFRIRKKQLLHLIRLAVSTPTTEVSQIGLGVPQGLSISNILSSIYLHLLDKKFKKKYKYFRYVDDILVICEMDTAKFVFEDIRSEMLALKLNCHELGHQGKSQIAQVTEGIEYLGFYITPTTISVRSSSYTRMIENILAVFTGYKHGRKRLKHVDQFVWQLNLKITGCIYNNDRYGWVFFFSQIDDLRQLARLDEFITKELDDRGLKHLRPRVKKFLRSYHEIRLNLSKTNYIPNFDGLNISEILRILSQAEGHSVEDYTSQYTEAQIRRKFTQFINRQTTMLEKDLIEALS